jgi:hypothetical protein
MDAPHRPPTREQAIFNLGLRVEAVSLYLLCCGLVDAGQPLSLASIAPSWNLDQTTLINNLGVLVQHGILAADGDLANAATRFRLQPSTQWRSPASA